MRRLLTETPRASLTSVGRSSVCLSVCPLRKIRSKLLTAASLVQVASSKAGPLRVRDHCVRSPPGSACNSADGYRCYWRSDRGCACPRQQVRPPARCLERFLYLATRSVLVPHHPLVLCVGGRSNPRKSHISGLKACPQQLLSIWEGYLHHMTGLQSTMTISKPRVSSWKSAVRVGAW